MSRGARGDIKKLRQHHPDHRVRTILSAKSGANIRVENAMAREPTLTIVEPTATSSLAPPVALGEAGCKLWHSIMGEYHISDSGGREMLLQICKAADLAERYAGIIRHDGATIVTKQGLKDHPLVRHELSARSFVVRGLQRLGLDIEPSRNQVGRPPGTFSRG